MATGERWKTKLWHCIFRHDTTFSCKRRKNSSLKEKTVFFFFFQKVGRYGNCWHVPAEKILCFIDLKIFFFRSVPFHFIIVFFLLLSLFRSLLCVCVCCERSTRLKWKDLLLFRPDERDNVHRKFSSPNIFVFSFISLFQLSRLFVFFRLYYQNERKKK